MIKTFGTIGLLATAIAMPSIGQSSEYEPRLMRPNLCQIIMAEDDPPEEPKPRCPNEDGSGRLLPLPPPPPCTPDAFTSTCLIDP
jgi:hypothetical protein